MLELVTKHTNIYDICENAIFKLSDTSQKSKSLWHKAAKLGINR